MTYDREKQQALNAEHVIRPQPGDYWHEMFAHVFLVVWRDGEHVEVLTCTEHTIDFPLENKWTWNTAKPAIRMTYEEFAAQVRDALCDVLPNRCRWAVEAALETRKAVAP